MPTYEYKCKSCENVQEELHSLSAIPKIVCSECGSECEKIFPTQANFVLKGSGWPSQEFKMKSDMSKKNSKMKTKMVERTSAGEGVNRVSDLAN